jgi:hypothetical protein
MTFFSYIGNSPTKDHQIDHINTNGNYEIGNVRWATRSEQQRNRTCTYIWFIKGKAFQTITEAAGYYMVKKQTIYKWVKGSLDNRRGTFTPARKDCYVESRY